MESCIQRGEAEFNGTFYVSTKEIHIFNGRRAQIHSVTFWVMEKKYNIFHRFVKKMITPCM